MSLVKAALEKIYRKVENVGSVFFVSEGTGCDLRDVVFRHSQYIGLEFEVLDLDGKPYYVGTKAHASALFNAFCGSCSTSEYFHSMTHYMNLWTWTAPAEVQVLDVEDAKIALF